MGRFNDSAEEMLLCFFAFRLQSDFLHRLQRNIPSEASHKRAVLLGGCWELSCCQQAGEEGK